jgi:hypothetical protein
MFRIHKFRNVEKSRFSHHVFMLGIPGNRRRHRSHSAEMKAGSAFTPYHTNSMTNIS